MSVCCVGLLQRWHQGKNKCNQGVHKPEPLTTKKWIKLICFRVKKKKSKPFFWNTFDSRSVPSYALCSCSIFFFTLYLMSSSMYSSDLTTKPFFLLLQAGSNIKICIFRCFPERLLQWKNILGSWNFRECQRVGVKWTYWIVSLLTHW